jgi:hypothetical protein
METVNYRRERAGNSPKGQGCRIRSRLIVYQVKNILAARNQAKLIIKRSRHRAVREISANCPVTLGAWKETLNKINKKSVGSAKIGNFLVCFRLRSDLFV